MKNISTVISELKNYYAVTPRVGHTSLVTRLLDHTTHPTNQDAIFIVLNRERFAQQGLIYGGASYHNVVNGNRVTIMTLDDVENGSLRGFRKPLVFDNGALIELLCGIEQANDRLQYKLDEANRELDVVLDRLNISEENLESAHNRISQLESDNHSDVIVEVYKQCIGIILDSVSPDDDSENPDLRIVTDGDEIKVVFIETTRQSHFDGTDDEGENVTVKGTIGNSVEVSTQHVLISGETYRDVITQLIDRFHRSSIHESRTVIVSILNRLESAVRRCGIDDNTWEEVIQALQEDNDQ